VSALYDSIARIARHEVAARATASLGIVVETFAADDARPPRDHAVTVKLRDTGTLLPRVPIAVGAVGFAAMPTVGELVVVVFLEGDTNSPVVVGRLYHSDMNPPPHEPGALVFRLPPDAEKPAVDAEIALREDEPRVRLALGEGVQVELTREKAVITMGKLSATIDGTGSGRVEIAAGKALVTMKTDGDVAVTAPGKLTLEGKDVEINGSASVKIVAAGVEIN
jgi:hypothetical protein